MDSDGNRLQNSCSPRHWGHSTMHRVPPVCGTTTTINFVPMEAKLMILFTTTCGVSHVLYMSHSLHTLFMNTVSVDCSLEQQFVSYWCVYSHADSQHKSTCRIYTIKTKSTPMHAYHTSVYC